MPFGLLSLNEVEIWAANSRSDLATLVSDNRVLSGCVCGGQQYGSLGCPVVFDIRRTPEMLWFASQERWSHCFLVVKRMRGIVQDGSGCLPPVLRHQVQPSPQSAGLGSRDNAGSGQGRIRALWAQAQGPMCTRCPCAPAKRKGKTSIFPSNNSSAFFK